MLASQVGVNVRAHIGAWRDSIGPSYAAHTRTELLKTCELNAYLSERFLRGGLGAALQSARGVGRDVARSLSEVARRERGLGAGLRELRGRLVSAARYGRLVSTLGEELFGSATFDGEVCLAENDFFRLSYLPPEPRSSGRPPLFHVGGFLPFSDRIFRLLPEANLFSPFVRAGFPVYAIELRGDRRTIGDVSSVTLDRVIDTIDAMSDIAFRHAGRRRMVLEGYCGLATPTLAYLAAKPRAADAKFGMAMVMVAPVDGRRCTTLAEIVGRAPDHMLFGSYLLAEVMGGGYLPGSQLRAAIDIPIGTHFMKSPLGCLATGWNRRRFHNVRTTADLSAGQRKELAGAYWISPENCDRFPLPVALVHIAAELWRRGIGPDGLLPARYRGEQLGLGAIAEGTRLPVVGIYGGEDKVVPQDTAHVLRAHLGERYTHVVHPRAGHVSYVFSEEIWDPGHPAALDPNPLDLITASMP